jgi:hypothetical protein
MSEESEEWRRAFTEQAGQLTALKRCLCGKMLQVTEHVRRWHSGVVNYDETLCGDCRKEFADKSRIVCLGCKSLQGFVSPTTEKTGFKFEGRKHYHIEKCPRCKPGIVATPVLEHESWCRHRRFPLKPNWDLVQEIEQKSLQGVKMADKLRAEINSPRNL